MGQLLQMQKQKCILSNTLKKNEENMIPQIENYKYPAAEPKGIKSHNMINNSK